MNERFVHSVARGLSLYAEFIRVEFLKMLAFRLRYYTGIVTYTIYVTVYYFLWRAIYANSAEIGNLNLDQIITYTAVAWIVRSFYYNNLDREISQQVVQGSLALELIRPYRYQWAKLSQSFGNSFFRLFFLALPSAVVIISLFPIKPPSNFGIFWAFICSVVLSFIVNTQINYLTGLVTIYTKNIHGIITTKSVVVQLLSGLIIPLSFYPAWAQRIMDYLPFRAIAYVPLTIYLGTIRGGDVISALGIQALWAGALFAAGHFFWRFSTKYITIQGG
ncbi:MAG: ABC transporter permease [bacterium]